jgi:cytochrome c553
MKKISLIMTIMVAVSTMVIIACNQSKAKEQPKETSPALSQEALVKRGAYLVSTAACDDCHTPKIMGPNGPEFDYSRRLSGHPSDEPNGKISMDALKEGWILFGGKHFTNTVGPWGVSYAANITSDTTGVGLWTEQQFFNAIRKGLSKGLEGNRPLLPPMPWFVYKNFSDEDLKAIFYFLKSTKPIKNVVPQPLSMERLTRKN